jgi:hypothetical protein
VLISDVQLKGRLTKALVQSVLLVGRIVTASCLIVAMLLISDTTPLGNCKS